MGHSSVAFVVGSSSPLDGGASLPLFTNAATASASHSFVLRGWSALMTAGRACSWSVRTATARRRVCWALEVLAPIFFSAVSGAAAGRVPSDVQAGAPRVSGRRRRAGWSNVSRCTPYSKTAFERVRRCCSAQEADAAFEVIASPRLRSKGVQTPIYLGAQERFCQALSAEFVASAWLRGSVEVRWTRGWTSAVSTCPFSGGTC